MEWENLKYFATLARTGTLTAAARMLSVQHSTVARRIARLELEFGEPLFVRTQGGYQLNRTGVDLLVHVEEIEAAILHIGSRNNPQPNDLGGVVRIGCTEGFGSYIAPRLLTSLAQKYPNLEIELIIQTRAINLMRNEADIVISIDRTVRGPYVTRKLFDYRLGLFASREYLARSSPVASIDGLEAHKFIDYVDEIEPARTVPTISEILHSIRARYRSSSLNAQKAIVVEGGGIALLPRFMVRPQDGLEAVLPSLVRVDRAYWMSTTGEAKKVKRIEAVWSFLASTSRKAQLFDNLQR